MECFLNGVIITRSYKQLLFGYYLGRKQAIQDQLADNSFSLSPQQLSSLN